MHTKKLAMLAVVALFTIGNVSSASAETIISASVFTTDSAYCGDGSHTVTAGDALLVSGGIGSFASGQCVVTMGADATFEIVGAVLSGIGKFEILPMTDTMGQSVEIRDSIVTVSRFGLFLSSNGASTNKAACTQSEITATGSNLGYHSGPDGETEVRGCTLTSTGPSPFGGNVFVMSRDGGRVEISDGSILNAPYGHIFVKIESGAMDVEVTDSFFNAAGTGVAGAGANTKIGSPAGETQVLGSDFDEAIGFTIFGDETEVNDNDFTGVPFGTVTIIGTTECESEGNSPGVDCS